MCLETREVQKRKMDNITNLASITPTISVNGSNVSTNIFGEEQSCLEQKLLDMLIVKLIFVLLYLIIFCLGIFGNILGKNQKHV